MFVYVVIVQLTLVHVQTITNESKTSTCGIVLNITNSEMLGLIDLRCLHGCWHKNSYIYTS